MTSFHDNQLLTLVDIDLADSIVDAVSTTELKDAAGALDMVSMKQAICI